MSIKAIFLAAMFCWVPLAFATPLTENEIFSAIDGEYDNDENSAERINYQLLPQTESVKAYSKVNPVTGSRTDFHFSLDVRDAVNMNDTFEQAPVIWVP